MLKFKKKLSQAQTEPKQSRFKTWKRGKVWLTSASAIAVLIGGAFAIQHAQSANANTRITGSATVYVNGPNGQSGSAGVGGNNYGQWNLVGKAGAFAGQTATEGIFKLGVKGTDGSLADAYCVDPFTSLNSSANANVGLPSPTWDGFSQDVKDRVYMDTYIADVQHNAFSNINIQQGAQTSIWEREGATVTITQDQGGLNASDVYTWRDNIQKATDQFMNGLSFNNQTLTVLAGTNSSVTDSNGNLGTWFPQNYISGTNGLTGTKSGDTLNVSAPSSAVGTTSSITAMTASGLNSSPVVYGTVNPDQTVGQNLLHPDTDPVKLSGTLNVKVVGLGETTLNKKDADTDSTTTQGASSLKDSEWTLYNKDTGAPVKWSDAGLSGYDITATNGTKVDNTNVVLQMTDPTKGEKLYALLEELRRIKKALIGYFVILFIYLI
ncbi:MAG: KxYKxGKxW signal peptide domain-containing protein [Streptococcaceae bacterium]|nr:KxYKxGKxW signal peptide domain-containing protein [Streptococcaceae bacterium]MCL2681147.1 KxYKxGKxW signal peptide domain-containing protein [Streptococcaceae bacterium]